MGRFNRDKPRRLCRIIIVIIIIAPAAARAQGVVRTFCGDAPALAGIHWGVPPTHPLWCLAAAFGARSWRCSRNGLLDLDASHHDLPLYRSKWLVDAGNHKRCQSVGDRRGAFADSSDSIAAGNGEGDAKDAREGIETGGKEAHAGVGKGDRLMNV
jgi:hypothetical protein